eukprot:SAG11_NODE_1451_length_4880_cov_3.477724_3_plen_162_part_00
MASVPHWFVEWSRASENTAESHRAVQRPRAVTHRRARKGPGTAIRTWFVKRTSPVWSVISSVAREPKEANLCGGAGNNRRFAYGTCTAVGPYGRGGDERTEKADMIFSLAGAAHRRVVSRPSSVSAAAIRSRLPGPYPAPRREKKKKKAGLRIRPCRKLGP